MGLNDLFFVRILRGAVVEVVTRWRPLLQALVLPALLMTASTYVTQFLMQWQFTTHGSIEGLKVLGYIQFVVWLLLYVLFGMSCHRVILLGDEPLPRKFGLYWTYRETRFLGWVIVIGIIYMLLTIPFQIAALYVPRLGWDWKISWYVPMLLATYVDGRVSMVLPATAVGERSSIVASWRLTRGKGLHIAAALFIVAIATDIFGSAVNELLDFVPQVGRLTANIISFPLVAVAVGVISVSYRELSKE